MVTPLRLGTLVMTSIMAVLPGHVVVTMQLTDPSPAFAEASVKAIDPAIRNHTGHQLTVSTFIDRTSLMEFIVAAYLDADGAGACAEKIALGSECAPIVGSVPDWMRTEKFEIRANLPPDSVPITALDSDGKFRFSSSLRRNVYPVRVQLMLQKLLAETFGLKVRRERRDVPVWAIMRGANDSTLMPTRAAAGTVGMNGWVGAFSLAPPTPAFTPDPPVRLMFEISTIKDAGDFLSAYLDRPVIDRTSLDGEFDFSLEFKINSRAPFPRGMPMMQGFDAARLAKAFEGVGLKIEPATAPFDILIIDQVQKPSLAPSSENTR